MRGETAGRRRGRAGERAATVPGWPETRRGRLDAIRQETNIRLPINRLDT
jgi:hypothetical protein